MNLSLTYDTLDGGASEEKNRIRSENKKKELFSQNEGNSESIRPFYPNCFSRENTRSQPSSLHPSVSVCRGLTGDRMLKPRGKRALKIIGRK